mmetsp:Transcript_24998/g.36044  ORF Transcript_24998/g.36044 Transcript_24998/m.36044 type:complete len:578 (-) Transcript_24998:1491-3224(-)
MAFIGFGASFVSRRGQPGEVCRRRTHRCGPRRRMVHSVRMEEATGEDQKGEEEIIEEAMRLMDIGTAESERKALALVRSASPTKELELLILVMDKSENEIVEATATVMLAQFARKNPESTDKCVKILCDRLSSDEYDLGIRSAAATGLGELKHEGSFEALRRAFYEDTEWAVQYAVLAALGNLRSTKALPLLIDALGSNISMLVQRSINSLGELRDPSAIPHLLQLVGKLDVVVEQSLAQALGSFTSYPKVVTVLKEMANSENPLTCFAAEEALQSAEVAQDPDKAQNGTTSDTPAMNYTIRELLERSFEQAQPPSRADRTLPLVHKEAVAEFQRMSPARQAEYKALCEHLKDGTIEDERAIAAIRLRSFPRGLKEEAVSQAGALNDPSQRVRASVLNLISHSPTVLASVLLGDPDQNVRSSACSALVECGEMEAGVLATIVAFQNDTHWIVRVSAAIALGSYAVNDKRAYDVLRESLCLKDGVPFTEGLRAPDALAVQCHAITSLGFVGNLEAIPLLDMMSRSSEAKVRLRTAAALGFLVDSQSLVILSRLVEDEDEEVVDNAVASRARLLEEGGC